MAAHFLVAAGAGHGQRPVAQCAGSDVDRLSRGRERIHDLGAAGRSGWRVTGVPLDSSGATWFACTSTSLPCLRACASKRYFVYAKYRQPVENAKLLFAQALVGNHRAQAGRAEYIEHRLRSALGAQVG